MFGTTISRPFLLRPFSTARPRWSTKRGLPTNTEGESRHGPAFSVPESILTPPSPSSASTPLAQAPLPAPPSSSSLGESLNPATSTPTGSTSLQDYAHSGPLPTSHASTETTSPKPSDETGFVPLNRKVVLELAILKNKLGEWTAQTAIVVRDRADGFTATTKERLSELGVHLNKATGYEEIDALKKEVVAQEQRIQETREAAKRLKIAHTQAVAQRSNSQREVNELLQRKSLWTDSDVGRFTTLVRQDHLYEQEEARTKVAADESEAKVEQEFSQLMRSILARYHEEQVWSDKIRSASTYGSLAALGLNLFVFITAIIFVEPWKRKRLAQTFEKKVEELSRDSDVRLEAGMGNVGKRLEGQETLLAAVAGELKIAIEQLARLEESGRSIAPRVSIPESSTSRAVSDENSSSSVPFAVEVEDSPLGAVSRSDLKLLAVGVGAFITGAISCLLLGDWS